MQNAGVFLKQNNTAKELVLYYSAEDESESKFTIWKCILTRNSLHLKRGSLVLSYRVCSKLQYSSTPDSSGHEVLTEGHGIERKCGTFNFL